MALKFLMALCKMNNRYLREVKVVGFLFFRKSILIKFKVGIEN
jgi:hypothetical protein